MVELYLTDSYIFKPLGDIIEIYFDTARDIVYPQSLFGNSMCTIGSEDVMIIYSSQLRVLSLTLNACRLVIL